jgi:hypothetical protein
MATVTRTVGSLSSDAASDTAAETSPQVEGAAGLLALPLLAVIKAVAERVEATQALAELMRE